MCQPPSPQTTGYLCLVGRSTCAGVERSLCSVECHVRVLYSWLNNSPVRAASQALQVRPWNSVALTKRSAGARCDVHVVPQQSGAEEAFDLVSAALVGPGEAVRTLDVRPTPPGRWSPFMAGEAPVWRSRLSDAGRATTAREHPRSRATAQSDRRTGGHA